MLVKICGVKSVEGAQMALDAGADLIGMIFVPNRKRTVAIEEAQKVAELVHGHRHEKASWPAPVEAGAHHTAVRARIFEQAAISRPKVVGVFQNQPLEEIVDIANDVGLDVIQLHGSEPIGMASQIPLPVIRRLTPGDAQFKDWCAPGEHWVVLVDSAAGGTGERVDWTALKGISDAGGKFMLAGGLTPANVNEAAAVDGVFGVDVSGGVETNGLKDREKVTRFVKAAKAAKANRRGGN